RRQCRDGADIDEYRQYQCPARRDELQLYRAGRFPESWYPQPVVAALYGAARLDDDQPDLVSLAYGAICVAPEASDSAATISLGIGAPLIRPFSVGCGTTQTRFSSPSTASLPSLRIRCWTPKLLSPHSLTPDSQTRSSPQREGMTKRERASTSGVPTEPYFSHSARIERPVRPKRWKVAASNQAKERG